MEERIILENFDKWTLGLEPKESAIAVFKHIRDIPYAIVPELRNPYTGPAGLLAVNKGSCQPKHFLLVKLFGKLNIPAKYATYPFRWGTSRENYPDDLKKMLKSLPIAYHLACKACINNRWVLVDATYDRPLKSAGFTVNEWDGLNDTANAVMPLEEIIHDTPEQRVDFETKHRSLYTEKEKAAYDRFIKRFNNWLDEVRR